MVPLSISKRTQRRFILGKQGLYPGRRWPGAIMRSVSPGEAKDRLENMLKAGKIAPVTLQEETGTQRFILAEDLPLLEQLHAGALPAAWQPLAAGASDEMIFLAPLDIVTARSRSLSLFDFEYIWEVYKPPEKRRWGYYTLPILYQDTLVARTDLKLERDAKTLMVKGFWLENHVELSPAFIAALARAFQRFMRFVEAEQLDSTALSPAPLREEVKELLNAR